MSFVCVVCVCAPDSESYYCFAAAPEAGGTLDVLVSTIPASYVLQLLLYLLPVPETFVWGSEVDDPASIHPLVSCCALPCPSLACLHCITQAIGSIRTGLVFGKYLALKTNCPVNINSCVCCWFCVRSNRSLSNLLSSWGRSGRTEQRLVVGIILLHCPSVLSSAALVSFPAEPRRGLVLGIDQLKQSRCVNHNVSNPPICQYLSSRTLPQNITASD